VQWCLAHWFKRTLSTKIYNYVLSFRHWLLCHIFVFLSLMQKLFGTINLWKYLGICVSLKNVHQKRNGDFQIVVDDKKKKKQICAQRNQPRPCTSILGHARGR
jgi:hypothetical protein